MQCSHKLPKITVLNQRRVEMKQVQHQPVQAYRHRFVHLKFGPGCGLHFSSIFCSNAVSLGLKILDCKAVLPGSGLFERPFPRSIRLNIPWSPFAGLWNTEKCATGCFSTMGSFCLTRHPLTGFETVCKRSAATTGYLYKFFLLLVVGTTILQPVGFSWSIGLWSFSRSGNRSHLSTRHCSGSFHWTRWTHLTFARGHCQESISTCQPMSCCSRNTIPQRETSESQERHLQESLHTCEPLDVLVCTPPVLGLILLDCKSFLCPMLCSFSQQAVHSPMISQLPGAPAVAGDATAKSSTCKLYRHTPQITCVDSNQNRWSNAASPKQHAKRQPKQHSKQPGK